MNLSLGQKQQLFRQFFQRAILPRQKKKTKVMEYRFARQLIHVDSYSVDSKLQLMKKQQTANNEVLRQQGATNISSS